LRHPHRLVLNELEHHHKPVARSGKSLLLIAEAPASVLRWGAKFLSHSVTAFLGFAKRLAHAVAHCGHIGITRLLVSVRHSA
jgi:hypothetical protein